MDAMYYFFADLRDIGTGDGNWDWGDWVCLGVGILIVVYYFGWNKHKGNEDDESA